MINNNWLSILLISVLLLVSSADTTHHWHSSPYGIPISRYSDTTEPHTINIAELQRIVKNYILHTENPISKLYYEPITQNVVRNFFIRKTGSEAITNTVLLYAEKRKLPIHLVFSLVFVESGFSTQAVNVNKTSRDFGLFQLNSRTFRHLKQEEFFHLETNVKEGTSYLAYAFNLASDPQTALAIYNAGPSRPLSGRTPQSTIKYVRKILDYSENMMDEFIQYVWEAMNLSETDKEQV